MAITPSDSLFQKTVDLDQVEMYELIHRTDKYVEPEKNLLMAVIRKAIDDLRNAPTLKKTEQRLQWFIEADHYDNRFSFLDCCEYLGLDYSYMRKKAIRIYEQKGGRM
jgi:hypothetical protein